MYIILEQLIEYQLTYSIVILQSLSSSGTPRLVPYLSKNTPSTLRLQSISKVRLKVDLVVVVIDLRNQSPPPKPRITKMALESATTINQLVVTNPVATDGLSQADDHLRLIKSTVKNTFPSVTGAITASHTEINTVADGNTAATSTTLVDADRVVVNDDGTMVQVAMSDVQTYVNANLSLSVATADIQNNAVTTAKVADGAITSAKLASGASFLSGMLMPYAGASAPSGWLMAYGQAVSRTTYADLFAAIGTTYGSGDGSTTFNLPDLRGRTIAGQDDMGGTSANRLTNQSGGLNGDTLGASGGSETHTLTDDEIQHIHGFGEWKGSNDDYRLIRTGVTWSGVGSYTMRGFNGEGGDDSVTDSTGDLTTTSVFLNGSDTPSAHNNVQPTIILNYIIKT